MFSIYSVETGIFTGQRLSGSAEFVAANTPDGCSAVAGEYDHLCRRVDIESGQVVAWQPPAPPDDEWRTWSWDQELERWVVSPTAAAVAGDVRRERDLRLASCDWVTARAVELGQPVPTQWVTYRQALRDITQQAGFPMSVDWPSQPPA